jgi:hypothetical protein
MFSECHNKSYPFSECLITNHFRSQNVNKTSYENFQGTIVKHSQNLPARYSGGSQNRQHFHLQPQNV